MRYYDYNVHSITCIIVLVVQMTNMYVLVLFAIYVTYEKTLTDKFLALFAINKFHKKNAYNF